jgi:hypothetical protein
MFELLEFEWRPRARRGVAQPGQRKLPRTQPWPRPAPGFWPYRLPLIEVLPLPDEEPDGELTDKLRDGVQRMPPGLRPHFAPIGTLEDAAGHRSAQGPGLYYFEFTAGRRRRAYSGESAFMAGRLKQHRERAITMGLNPKFIKVFVAQGPGSRDKRRAQEKLFHQRMFRHHPDFLTNQNLELGLPAGCSCRRCQLVRVAGSAAQAAARGDGSPQALRRAVLAALRSHAPGGGRP